MPKKRPIYSERIKRSHPRLIQKIEKYFKKERGENLSFGQILDKYCKIGESRNTIRKRLIRMTKKQIKIADSTLYESILSVIRNHDTSFEFAAKRSGNPLAKYHRKSLTVSKKMVKALVTCVVCGTKEIIKVPEMENIIIGLDTFNCKHCQTIGKASGVIKVQGKIIRKEMKPSDITGILEEKIVSEEKILEPAIDKQI